MTAQLIDRRALKAETRETLAEAQVSPKAFTALYLALVLAMNLVDSFTGIGMLATFVSILITLLALVLEAGFVLYCMAVRQGERAEFLALFDGFSFAGKVIGLSIVNISLSFSGPFSSRFPASLPPTGIASPCIISAKILKSALWKLWT